jgi:alpha-glucosidase (family GH31 glycosyl hydrolase)
MHEEFIMDHFKFPTKPIADEKAVIKGDHYRFTVLTSRLIRLEYSLNNHFEDRPSQTVWFRELSVPQFKAEKSDKKVSIETDHLVLEYNPSKKFSSSSLSIYLKKLNKKWRYGGNDRGNLKGTFRTLDVTNGWSPLGKGLLSRNGYAVINDSESLVFNEHCWLTPREEPVVDMYFFGYGTDYLDSIKEYYQITGKTPMIPRYILGNWWSRYWEYTEAELKQLILDFEQNRIPLSVCIIDMDWHLVNIDKKYGSGWTGYTWNKELFPDPKHMLDWLHEKQLKVALNLHPALGIRAHEEGYPAMADFMGVNKTDEQPIPFDIADPKFVKGYFEHVHHPLEKQGVDFWWLDWQQGTKSRIAKLDPLWMLNHLHFLDLGRDHTHRSFVFSRYAGRGCHRYPIGFSGDTWVSWRSLKYQPYFTTTASNIGFGWWSHDIGGHMNGKENAELYARWVQFGVFSPIMRLHSSKKPFYKREPWKYDMSTLLNAGNWMRFRHQLIPYIYSMAYQNYANDIPLMRPLYYFAPDDPLTYKAKYQYWYGSEFIVSPVVEKSSKQANRVLHPTYLPKEHPMYFNLFTKEYFEGGQNITQVYEITEVPVFAKSGAIVPLADGPSTNSTDNPSQLTVEIFPGASNTFNLYEDDGNTEDYRQGNAYITKMQLNWGETVQFTLEQPVKKPSYIPKNRVYKLCFNAIEQPSAPKIHGIPQSDYTCEYSSKQGIWSVQITNSEFEKIQIDFACPNIIKKDATKERAYKMLMDADAGTLRKTALYKLNFTKAAFGTSDLIGLYRKIARYF